MPVPRRDLLAPLRKGPLQAHDVAAAAGLDVSVARRRLETMRRQGLVSSETVAEGRGRPKKRYVLTAAGEETFPRDYATILSAVVDAVREDLGDEAVMRILGTVADRLAGAPPQGDRQARLQAVRRLYDRLGFEPAMRRTRHGAVLTQRNCIVMAAARADPGAFCDGLDEGILRRLLPDADVRITECMATGDRRCCHDIRWKGTP